MKIEVNLYATLKRYMENRTSGKPSVFEISDGDRVKDIIQKLKVPADSVKLIFINGVHAKVDTPLKDGDRLGLFPPVGGG